MARKAVVDGQAWTAGAGPAFRDVRALLPPVSTFRYLGPGHERMAT
jgi:hypothetical protein